MVNKGFEFWEWQAMPNQETAHPSPCNSVMFVSLNLVANILLIKLNRLFIYMIHMI